MWTNNMKKLISYIFATGNSGTFKPILPDGTEFSGSTISSFPWGQTSTSSSSYIIINETTNAGSYKVGKFGLLVGIGTTEPSVEDYCLANQVELTPVSFQCTNSDGTLFPTVTHTMRNNSGGTLIITEIGLYWAPISSSPPCLLGRKLLETPVTMEDGEAYTFQYNIDLRNLSE